MYTPEDSPFEKFRTQKLKGVAMSPDVRELVALAYESGFIDGMQKQMQSSVDRAVNRMADSHLASLKRDMRKTLEDAAVRATHKVMADLEHDEHAPNCSPEEFLMRGILASELKCWHRLTGDEAQNLLDFVRNIPASFQEKSK